MSLQIEIIRTGVLKVNASVVYDDATRECVVVDVGEFPAVDEFITENNLLPKMVLATHGHFDHTAGVRQLCEKYNCFFAMSMADWAHISPENTANISDFMDSCGYPNFSPPQKIDVNLNDDAVVLPFGIQIIKTAGHSAGGVCFYIPDLATLLSGDTLFYETIGRTDLRDSNHGDILKNIREKLFVLPDETRVVAGHGKITAVGHEKKYNSFFLS